MIGLNEHVIWYKKQCAMLHNIRIDIDLVRWYWLSENKAWIYLSLIRNSSITTKWRPLRNVIFNATLSSHIVQAFTLIWLAFYFICFELKRHEKNTHVKSAELWSVGVIFSSDDIVCELQWLYDRRLKLTLIENKEIIYAGNSGVSNNMACLCVRFFKWNQNQ